MGRIFDPPLRMDDLPTSVYWVVTHQDGKIIDDDRSLFFKLENALGNMEGRVNNKQVELWGTDLRKLKAPYIIEILHFKLTPADDYRELVGSEYRKVIGDTPAL